MRQIRKSRQRFGRRRHSVSIQQGARGNRPLGLFCLPPVEAVWFHPNRNCAQFLPMLEHQTTCKTFASVPQNLRSSPIIAAGFQTGIATMRLAGIMTIVFLLARASVIGGTGTWINPAGGSWTNSSNWSGGVIADGSGSTANFATLTLPADTTLTLDAPRVLGSLSFDDLGLTKHNWFLHPGNGGSLTLSGTSPTITVWSAATTFYAGVAGSAGLTKAGPGRLALLGDRSYSGATTVESGSLALGGATFSVDSPLNIVAASAVLESSGTLNLTVNTSSTAIDISGAGVLRLMATTNSSLYPDVYFGPNHSGNTCWGARLDSPVELGSLQRYIFGKTGHNGVGPYGLTGADCQFAGPISGSGGLTFIAQNSWTGPSPMEVAFALNASNSFTGPVEIQRGSVYLGNVGALVQGNALSFNPASGHNARLFLYGNDASVSDLSSPGPGAALIANGNLKSGATVTLGTVTLTLNQHHDTTFAGTLTDVYAEYTGSGSGTTGPLNILKKGAGNLRLTGTCSHSGTTTINGGTLEVDGRLGSGTVAVQSGASLSGTGTIGGPVTLLPGAMLRPGSDAQGALMMNNSLTLSGTTVMRLAKVGTTLSSDQVLGISLLTLGGSLIVTNVGDPRTGALSAGDSFTLLGAATCAGLFSNISLPSLSAGLAWDTANLLVNGSLTVISETGAPLIVAQPQDLVAVEGSTASLTAVAAGPRPMDYQWNRNGVPITGATQSAYTIPRTSTNDAGPYSIVITNPFGSLTSAVATLTVLLLAEATSLTNGLVVYLNFDNNIDAQAGTTNKGVLYTGGATLGPRYTPGVIGSAVTFANAPTTGQPNDWAISLGNLDWVFSNSFSVSLWERTLTSGDGALIGNKDWSSGANVGWVISSLEPKNVNWNAAGGTRRDVNLNPPFSDGNWHLVTVTFDRVANQVISYVDGVAVNTSDISPSGTASLNTGFSTLVGSSGNGFYSGTADVDDLGIWARALSPQEVAGVFGAGLAQRPLTQALPGVAPLITSQPVDLNLTPGLTATFSVAATGPGPLRYQWRINGTNIPGATNASLVLGPVTAANQGVYSVLVSNGSGASLSAGAVLTVYALAVTGQWDFKHGDLRATVGADLEFVGDTSNLTSFPLVDINGQSVRVMEFGSNSVSQGFYMRHGAKPNGGGQFVNQYTLIMDLFFPAQSTGQWRALFQTDPFNHPENDAEFYVGGDTALPDPGGIGADGQYNGTLAADTWYRIAFSVDLTASPGQQLSKYVNGTKVATQSLPGGIDGRYALGPAAILFTTGLNGPYTAPGFVNSLQFVNGWMPPEGIATLGGPTAVGLPPGNAVLRIDSMGANASVLTVTWTGTEGHFQLQKSSGLSTPTWQDIGGLVTNHSLSLPIVEASAFYRVNQFRPDIQVGQLPYSEQAIPSTQVLRAAGQSTQFSGRPVDLVLSPDGTVVYLKNMNNLLVLEAVSWKLRQSLSYPGSGASMHGIAVTRDGSRIYATGSNRELYEWRRGTNGVIAFSRTIALPAGSFPCGLALSADATKAYVALSIPNVLAVVDLAGGTVMRQLQVGVAPWDVVLSPDGTRAYISDWGGRFPVPGDLTAPSAGTPVVIDARGIASSGAVSFVDLVNGLQTAQVATDLHPSALQLSADGSTLFAANANSDTVTVIDTQSKSVRETILVRPDSRFQYGSAADGLALSPDGKTLFVANGGNNAIAVVELPNALHTNSVVRGFLPTDWYPGAVVADTNFLYVANVKGLGSRLGQPANSTWQIGAFLGTANKIPIPSLESLNKYTAQVFEDGRIRQIRETALPPQTGVAPTPVPARVGEPSVFQHVLYILKENKTYDQVFGDLTRGNGNASLCIYPEFVSPNHHALARQFVLLDNYYCNGVNSADGHSWSTEGNCTDHLEKSLGGYARSYTFGDDPLTYSSSGFIWNNVLQHGLSFRNYGEMDYASPSPPATWMQMFADYTNGTRAIHYVQNIGVASLRPYSSTNVPGWNMQIPDQVRADGFIRELKAAEATGSWASLHLLYLPNDHTGGPPTPRAQVADNDLALGKVVEALSRSAFWTNTVIFVLEDDPQSGYDHVDGHRSLCLVISPYTKRGQVVSTFYNQAGVLHTIEQILGLRPMNQQDAMAPLMFECFTNVPDFAPYTALPNNVPLAEGVAATGALSPRQRYWAKKLQRMDFSRPDRINEDTFNRYIWFTIKGNAPYPSEFVGAHGRGLKQLGLKLDPTAKDPDD